ncbi:MAG: HTTM domain-containing protein [Bdellovibrio sp.]|jgi:vitamin K-dependent gamma-carboxylase
MIKSSWLLRSHDNASLVFYRVYFGLLVAWSLTRFWWNGWLERSFIEPTHFFSYWGFDWVTVPAPVFVYALFVIGILSGLAVAFGFLYRFASLALFLSFTYIELMDLSNYLNHYYLVSLLAFLNLFLPLNTRLSLDVVFGWTTENKTAPAWCLNLLRFQVATVYFFAGIAKLGSDWLLFAQPMHGWMMAQGDLPLIGTWLTQTWVQYVMAWSGFLFDTTIWIWMLIPRTRLVAYGVIVVFHALTSLFFPIGLFPLIMIGMATVFFSPTWPLQLAAHLQTLTPWRVDRDSVSAPSVTSTAPSLSRARGFLLQAGIGSWVCFQFLMPLRHLAYDSHLLWSEEGMRFSWKVMVREKNGQVTFKVVDRKSDRTWDVSPAQYLAQHQELEMSGQPDLILQMAHLIRDDFKGKGFDVAVYAEAWVSLNSRPAQLMIDPKVDLTTQADRLTQKNWILPAPSKQPTAPRPVVALKDAAAKNEARP